MRTSFVRKSLSLDKSRKLYESLRQQEYSFGSKQDTPIKSLIPSSDSRVVELEAISKVQRMKIKDLKRQVKDLSEKLSQMEAINRQLLNNKLKIENSDMHYLVQEMIVSDMKQQLAESELETQKYRLELEKQKRRAEASAKNNVKLQGSIKRYRNLVNTDRRNESIECLPSIKKSETYLTSPSSQPKESKYKTQLSYLVSLLAEISRVTSIKPALDVIAKTCRQVAM